MRVVFQTISRSAKYRILRSSGPPPRNPQSSKLDHFVSSVLCTVDHTAKQFYQMHFGSQGHYPLSPGSHRVILLSWQLFDNMVPFANNCQNIYEKQVIFKCPPETTNLKVLK